LFLERFLVDSINYSSIDAEKINKENLSIALDRKNSGFTRFLIDLNLSVAKLSPNIKGVTLWVTYI